MFSPTTTMEATLASLSYYKYQRNPLLYPSSSSQSSTLVSSNSVCFKNSTRSSLQSGKLKRSNLRPLNASSNADSISSDQIEEKWLLEPVGDGDSRHIGFKVSLPDAYEINSSVVTVGRVPEKADMVIPVATVSGVHARIKKKDGSLLVTDLNSTNGTFVNEKRLRAGEVAEALPGNYITFGDSNLAIFRVSKLKKVDLPEEPEKSEVKFDADVQTDNAEITS